MNKEEFRELVSLFNSGDLSPEKFEELQELLKVDAELRKLYREMVDLEVGLRALATESEATYKSDLVRSFSASAEKAEAGGKWRRSLFSFISIAASVAISVIAITFLVIAAQKNGKNGNSAEVFEALGTLTAQKNCVWNTPEEVKSGSRITRGTFELASGMAELILDSGVVLVLDGPGSLTIDSINMAQLLNGNIYVTVSELSDGFDLVTPDALVVDNGTEYSVSVNEISTDVHVFDGSVYWNPVKSNPTGIREQINEGEAISYPRSSPFRGKRIPLGKRRHMRRIQERKVNNAAGGILAYDGFDNISGNLRRSSSSYGWQSGWEKSTAGRGRIASIIDTPPDSVFGIDRTGHRMLQIKDGEAIERSLENPLPMLAGKAFYLSFLLDRSTASGSGNSFFELSIGSDDKSPRRRSKRQLSLGCSSDSVPYIKAAGKLSQSSMKIISNNWYMFVMKVAISEDNRIETFLRVFEPSKEIGELEPTAWTLVASETQGGFNIEKVRVKVGGNGLYHIDELRIGSSWQSAISKEPE